VYPRKSFHDLRQKLHLQHVNDFAQLHMLIHPGRWILDFDMTAVKHASEWCLKANDSAGVVLFSHPMRAKGSVMCRVTADWQDPCWGRQSSHRAGFVLFGRFASPGKPGVRKFLHRSAAAMESGLQQLALTLKTRPSKPTQGFPAFGSGGGARAEAWTEWM
jgi:hypothetical protein